MSGCIFIILVAIHEYCSVPLTHLGCCFFICKAIKVGFTHIKTQGFCSSLVSMLLVDLSYKKADIPSSKLF